MVIITDTSPLDDLDDGDRQKARRANQNLACRVYIFIVFFIIIVSLRQLLTFNIEL